MKEFSSQDYATKGILWLFAITPLCSLLYVWIQTWEMGIFKEFLLPIVGMSVFASLGAGVNYLAKSAALKKELRYVVFFFSMLTFTLVSKVIVLVWKL